MQNDSRIIYLIFTHACDTSVDNPMHATLNVRIFSLISFTHNKESILPKCLGSSQFHCMSSAERIHTMASFMASKLLPLCTLHLLPAHKLLRPTAGNLLLLLLILLEILYRSLPISLSLSFLPHPTLFPLTSII